MIKPILSFLLFTISFSIYSQTIHEIGFTVGLADSHLITEYQYGEEDFFQRRSGFRLGFNAHAFANFHEKKNFHMQASLGYVEKGAESTIATRNDGDEGPFNFGNYERVLTKYNYISLATGGVGRVRWKSIELNTNAKPRIDVLISRDEPDILLGDVGKDIKKINLGLVYGLGFKWYLSEAVAVSLHYDHNFNFTPINKTEYSPGTFGLEIWDNTKFINLGFNFKINQSEVG